MFSQKQKYADKEHVDKTKNNLFKIANKPVSLKNGSPISAILSREVLRFENKSFILSTKEKLF